MTKYIMLYKGPATPMEEMTQEQGAAVMEKWGTWMGKVGSSLLDVGNPFAQSAAVTDDGKDIAASDLNGFSIVEADNIEGAKALTDGHPFLSDNDGKFAIEIYELAPVPM